MSADEEDYGDFAEEDFIEALSQASQTLPKHRRTSRDSTESSDEEGNGKSKKKKYKIHEGVHEVPKASMYCLKHLRQLCVLMLIFHSHIRSNASRGPQPRFKPIQNQRSHLQEAKARATKTIQSSNLFCNA